MNKVTETIENYINGNFTDYKESVREMTPLELSDLVSEVMTEVGFYSLKKADLMLTMAMLALARRDDVARKTKPDVLP